MSIATNPNLGKKEQVGFNIRVENHKGVFEETIGQMNEDGISLVGAVHDYTDPATGKGYLYFPIREV